MYQINFEKVCQTLSLGTYIKETPIRGGLLHKMFQVETDQKRYAIKAINPQIIKRPPAMGHYKLSEALTQLAVKSGIHAVPALVIHNEFIHLIEGQYYMVFDWVEGETITEDITVHHTLEVGKVLAKIHNLKTNDLDHGGFHLPKTINWSDYLFQDAPWQEDLKTHYDQLISLEMCMIKASQNLSSYQVLSHRDLDPKNVMWHHHKPIIIDWESAGLIHPLVELLRVGLYWYKEDEEKFKAVFRGYQTYRSIDLSVIEDALYAMNEGLFGWLDYSMKRSLGIGIAHEDEIDLGIQETTETIQMIINHQKVMSDIRKWIK